MKRIAIFANFALLIFLTSTAVSAQSAHRSSPVTTTFAVGGQLIDTAGKPGCFIRVCGFAEDFDETKPNQTIPCARSDDQGNFMLLFNRTGKYRIFADQAEQGYWTTRMEFFRAPGVATTEVIIDRSIARSPLTIMLPPKNGMIRGRSIDLKTGLPVESVTFALCHAANPRVCRGTVAKSADGSFEIPAPHVPFTLRARAEGFNEWYGLTGSDTTEISVVGGSSIQLNLLLSRQVSAADKAVSELEKQPGLHLPAPVQLKPQDGIVFDKYPRITKLEWASVEGAVSYSLEIDYCQPDRIGRTCVKPTPLDMPANPATTGITGTTYEFGFVGAQPGRWRVWAVDKDGREGFKSSWRIFAYLQ